MIEKYKFAFSIILYNATKLTQATERMVKAVQCQGKEVLLRTAEDDKNNFSFLNVMDRVDQFPDEYEEDKQFKEEVLYLTSHDNIRIGFTLLFAVKEMLRCCGQELFDGTFTIKQNEGSLAELKFNDDKVDIRNAKIDRIARILYEKSELKEIKGWRDEKYAVYVHGSPYVLVERAMAGVLGIVTYGIHVNGYLIDTKTNGIKFWIPRRSATKPTWPLMLDNIIAGGIGYPHGINDTVIKESMEEANLSKTDIERRIRAAGVLSYFYFPQRFDQVNFDSESAYIVGEVEYIFDLALSEDVVPKPNDGEVDSFNLLTLQETIDAIARKEFKPNCALVMTDFLIRHGYITSENEPNFLELVNRMHRKLPFPQPNFYGHKS
ncbi:ZYRO0B08844p [Zygosaccharomyces rouxii]|uniref:ZYRO0B08844p n=1 Tax=Zygosaccharomyces rouxii (strain ATCC 2623 / CBS 732 / NBRC 1130 / NCYC 568 / NRRL Y-229) TaxID=559307 RepID=C5DRJ1_ZYGRC|nr:uncharacterized protein ZYRO0B08844g [Zygosaccharomyces rouxii]CAR26402.1 ZYRO0B08844p [Zygosaccharomyces rouxii]